MKGVWSKHEIYYYITERSVFGSENVNLGYACKRRKGYIFFYKIYNIRYLTKIHIYIIYSLSLR